MQMDYWTSRESLLVGPSEAIEPGRLEQPAIPCKSRISLAVVAFRLESKQFKIQGGGRYLFSPCGATAGSRDTNFRHMPRYRRCWQ